MHESSTPAPPATVGVVAVGLGAPTRLLPDQTPVTRVAEPDPVAIVEGLQETIRRRGTALVLLPGWRDDLCRALQTARSSLDVDTIAVHAVESAPLAGAVLAAQAQALADDGVPLGPLAAAMPALEAQVLPVAWLSSVARLSRLTPSMKQHVRSLLPGAAFVAYGGRAPRVERVHRADPHLPLPIDLAGHTMALSAHPQGQRDPVEQALADLGMAGRVVEVPPLAESAEWWGTDRLVEMAAYRADVASLRRHLTARPSTCPWCRRPTAADPCPQCGMRRLVRSLARG